MYTIALIGLIITIVLIRYTIVNEFRLTPVDVFMSFVTGIVGGFVTGLLIGIVFDTWTNDYKNIVIQRYTLLPITDDYILPSRSLSGDTNHEFVINIENKLGNNELMTISSKLTTIVYSDEPPHLEAHGEELIETMWTDFTIPHETNKINSIILYLPKAKVEKEAAPCIQ